MYAHTSVVHAMQMQRHESPAMLETVNLVSHIVHSPSEHEHIVSFRYDEEDMIHNNIPQIQISMKHFNGRTWS